MAFHITHRFNNIDQLSRNTFLKKSREIGKTLNVKAKTIPSQANMEGVTTIPKGEVDTSVSKCEKSYQVMLKIKR